MDQLTLFGNSAGISFELIDSKMSPTKVYGNPLAVR